MHPLTVTLSVLVAAIVPCAWSQSAQVMHVEDAAGAVAGVAHISDYDGPLPTGDLFSNTVDQMPGFPITLPVQGTFGPSRGTALADLDRDGDLELVVCNTDYKVYAFDLAGNPVPGFPVSTTGFPQYTPAIGDLDGDGDVEIVFTTRGMTSGGRLYAIDHRGSVLPGFPVNMNNNNIEYTPALYDLDRDGKLEIIVGERAYPLGKLHVVRLDGTLWSGNWPVQLDHVPAIGASVADVDGNGSPEIFCASYNSMYLLRADGTLMPGFPLGIPNANFSYQSAVLADLDDDDDLEIVVGAHRNASGCYVFHHDGTPFPGWPQRFQDWTYCPPTVTDLEGDGKLEIIDGSAGGYGDSFWVWNTAGQVRPGFPYRPPQSGSEGPLTVADINGDGVLEIFADCKWAENGSGFLYGVDANGNDLPGFPLRPQGFTYMKGATIGDVDDDGDYELAVLSADTNGTYVNLYTLTQKYRPTGRDWLTYRGQNRRLGQYPAFPLGDLNCDGAINFGDINPFVLALSDPKGYRRQYPDCNPFAADVNGDGVVDFGDINPFVELLSEQ